MFKPICDATVVSYSTVSAMHFTASAVTTTFAYSIYCIILLHTVPIY
jgi:hypothetical protein